MRYLTREWQDGDLDEAASDRAANDYAARLTAIAPRLSESMRRLAHELYLHDALIDSVDWAPHVPQLTLRLVADVVPETRGAPETYHLVVLTYVGVRIDEANLQSLRRACDSRTNEVLRHEVDIDDELVVPRPVHRILFTARESLNVSFDELVLETSPREDRRLDSCAFTEISPPSRVDPA